MPRSFPRFAVLFRVFPCLILLSACYNPPQRIILDTAASEMTDSSMVTLSRPYGVGYNLVVNADSVLLLEERPMHWSEGALAESDSLWLARHDRIVIAALTVIPEDSVDSVWVKVARDQLTMGWLHEAELLHGTSPADPISRFILFFSDVHVLWFLIVMAGVMAVLLVAVLRRKRFSMILVNDIPSIYPTLLTVTLSLSALLYAFIQHSIPQQWVQFFYHPTLNPFSQPPLLCAFLCTVWALFLMLMAVLDDVVKLLPTPSSAFYLFSLLGVCMVIYLAISLLPVAVATLLCIAYILFAFMRYWTHGRPRYLCGRCHARLRHKGVCPRCGALNE